MYIIFFYSFFSTSSASSLFVDICWMLLICALPSLFVAVYSYSFFLSPPNVWHWMQRLYGAKSGRHFPEWSSREGSIILTIILTLLTVRVCACLPSIINHQPSFSLPTFLRLNLANLPPPVHSLVLKTFFLISSLPHRCSELWFGCRHNPRVSNSFPLISAWIQQIK